MERRCINGPIRSEFGNQATEAMIILSKLADYGVIVATHLAAYPNRQLTAGTVATETRLPQATVAKLLKALAHARPVTAARRAAAGCPLALARGLQVRVCNRYRGGTGAAGSYRGHGPLHFRQERRAGMAPRMAPRGLPRVARDGPARLGQAQSRADRLPGCHLLFRAEA